MFRDKKFFEQKAADQVFGTGSNLFYLKQNFLNPSFYKKTEKPFREKKIKKKFRPSVDRNRVHPLFFQTSMRRIIQAGNQVPCPIKLNGFVLNSKVEI